MSAGVDYQPPAVEVMQRTQDTTEGLRLLVAQRRMYRVAKRWQGLRWLGVLILAVAAPFIALLVPSSAVVVGAVAGVWIFLGRTLLTWAETRTMTQAACVQEDFDLLVFEMPRSIERSAAPSPEDVAHVVGEEAALATVAAKEKLPEWYVFGGERSGSRAVAIAQRANASYTAGLIRTVVVLWSAIVVVWAGALIILTAATGVRLDAFLLGVALPVLPSLLDVIEYLLSTWRAGLDRADLARSIERRLNSQGVPIEGQQLLVWQERLFDLRRTTPQVPDWLYRLTRKGNEMAMKSAARRLSA